jgi:kinesin family protein 3/17
MTWLLNTMNSQFSKKFSVSVSYLELYNDIKIIDLLDKPATFPSTNNNSNGNATPTKQLEIRENRTGEIIIPGLTRVPVSNSVEVLDVLWEGAKARSVAATDMNEHSSRSHTVFQVYLEINLPNETRRSKICLVDLAGSEKWKSHQLSQFSEARIKELTSINRSLSALGNCISALLKTGRAHIPYRDSKLTRLLQDSLGGNTRTIFVVTLSPSFSCSEETLSTLQFADRAMRVQVFASANKTNSLNYSAANVILMQEKYDKEIKRLKSLLSLILEKSGGMFDIKALAKEIAANDLENGSNKVDGNVSPTLNALDFDACVSQELIDLKDENVSLLQELSRTQEELRIAKDEKQKILNAVFDMPPDHCAASSSSEVVADRLEMALSEAKSSSDASALLGIQYRVLQAQRDEIESRREALEEADVQQEDRWNWLQQYHAWLQAQNHSKGLDGVPANPNVENDDVYRRVCLMEASVLLQADELQRTKKLFLKVSNKYIGSAN